MSYRPRTSTMFAVAAFVFALAGAAAAQIPRGASDAGPPNTRDEVTGYLCTNSFCDVLRLPQSNCLCTKENPNERDLSKLRLRCSASEGFRWVACPVKPRYGISVD